MFNRRNCRALLNSVSTTFSKSVVTAYNPPTLIDTNRLNISVLGYFFIRIRSIHPETVTKHSAQSLFLPQRSELLHQGPECHQFAGAVGVLLSDLFAETDYVANNMFFKITTCLLRIFNRCRVDRIRVAKKKLKSNLII